MYKLKVNNIKHFTKLFIGILFLILGGTQSGFAQTTIDNMLLDKAVDPATVAGTDEYVYLYNVTYHKFVHGGGEFGAQAVLSDRGICFKVTTTTNGKYRLESAILINLMAVDILVWISITREVPRIHIRHI